MTWTSLILGVGLALTIIGVLSALMKVAGLLASAIDNRRYSARFYLEYAIILAGSLMIGVGIGA